MVDRFTLADVDTFALTLELDPVADTYHGQLLLVAGGVPVWSEDVGDLAMADQDDTADLEQLLIHAADVELSFLGLRPAPEPGTHAIAVADDEYTAIYCAPVTRTNATAVAESQ